MDFQELGVEDGDICVPTVLVQVRRTTHEVDEEDGEKTEKRVLVGYIFFADSLKENAHYSICEGESGEVDPLASSYPPGAPQNRARGTPQCVSLFWQKARHTARHMGRILYCLYLAEGAALDMRSVGGW